MPTTEKPDKLPIKYACPICRELYETPQQAEECRDQGIDDGGWKVGEFLLIPQLAVYQDLQNNESKWLAFQEPAWPDSPSHFDHREKLHYWYIVLGFKMDRDRPHRLLLVVWTGVDLYCAGKYGWNPCDGDGHYGLYRPGDISGATAKNCAIHDPKYNAERQYGFLQRSILNAVPPKDLITDKAFQAVRERIMEKPHEIPLL